MNSVNPLSLPPSTATTVIPEFSARPGDVMTFVCHAPSEISDGERSLVWRAPDGCHVVTLGFVDAHPWTPSHRTTVFLCNEKGVPGSNDPQPGSMIGIVDHRTAAETWWRLTAPTRAKWQAAIDVLADIPVDADHYPQIPITSELEQILRLTLPWVPSSMWPEWCRRAYKMDKGMLARGNGRPFSTPIGPTPPQGMIE